MNDSGLLAIIGGTGVDLRGDTSPLRETRDEVVDTRWGAAHITRGRHRWELPDAAGQKYFEHDIIFLHRHAAPHDRAAHVPPHRINYRANIAALKKLGVTAIFASTAVGSLRPDWRPGTLVLLDQFLDCTAARAKTFFDEHLVHVDVTQPYSSHLRELLQRTAASLSIPLQERGTYVCTDGPRFETPAEIRAYASWGADVVGMTGVPEVVLAREANIAYAGVSIVTNAAAGILEQPLTQAEVLAAMDEALPRVTQLFLAAARKYRDHPASLSRRATREFRTATFDPDAFITAS